MERMSLHTLKDRAKYLYEEIHEAITGREIRFYFVDSGCAWRPQGMYSYIQECSKCKIITRKVPCSVEAVTLR